MKKLMQKGFTLIELVVFIVIIGIVGTGLFIGLDATLQSEREVDEVEHALMLAQQRMEMILGQRQEVGFASFTDPCSPAIFPDFVCAAGGFAYGFTVGSTITPNWGGDTNYKVITVTVTGAGTATLTTIVGDFDA